MAVWTPVSRSSHTKQYNLFVACNFAQTLFQIDIRWVSSVVNLMIWDDGFDDFMFRLALAIWLHKTEPSSNFCQKVFPDFSATFQLTLQLLIMQVSNISVTTSPCFAQYILQMHMIAMIYNVQMNIQFSSVYVFEWEHSALVAPLLLR